LVELHGLVPQAASVGETLEIHGRGLPEGVAAKVVFEGSVHRAGEKELRGVRIVATARPAAGNRLAIPLSEQLHSEFCGVGDRSEHATFRGRIHAVFLPQAQGSSKVHGTLARAVLDLSGGPLSRAALRRRSTEASQALTALGLELGPSTEGQGLVVLRARGHAAAAGLAAGDYVLELDGLVLRTRSDFRPTGDQPWTLLLVRRQGITEPIIVRLSTEGLGPSVSFAKIVPVVLAWLAALLLVFWLGPADRVVTWAASSLRERILGPALATSVARRGRVLTWARLVQPDNGAWTVRPRLLILLAALTAATTALALGGPLVAPTWDVWVFTAAIMAGAGVTGVLAGGSASGRGFLLSSGLVSATKAVFHQTPMAVGVLAATLVGGSSSLTLAVHDQSGFMHRWAVFSNPGLLVSFRRVWISLIPQPDGRDALAADRTPTGVRGIRLARSLDWLTLTATCVLVSVLYLGGWALPWPTSHAATRTAIVAGVVFFQMKCWLLVLSVLLVRRWVLNASVFEMTGLWARTVVPLSMGAFLAACLWHELVTAGPLDEAKGWIPSALLAMSLAMAGLAGYRFLKAARSRSASLSVSPWL